MMKELIMTSIKNEHFLQYYKLWDKQLIVRVIRHKKLCRCVIT